MEESITEKKCNRSGCELATSGVCAEGYEPLEACPFYGKELSEVSVEDNDDSITNNVIENKTDEHTIQLATGEALGIEEMGELLRWRPVSCIAIVGDRDSGKTTLICSIYNQFLRGPFAEHVFAGCRTLVAFERNSHHSRVESGRTHPDTAHTSMNDGLKFFHLATVPKDSSQERSDLVFSDRAGEMYKQARNNSDYVSELSEIKNSDRVVLLLDGGRLANATERAGAIQSVRQMIRAFVDGGALGRSSIVQVVTTKTDLLAEHPDKQAIDIQLDNFRDKLKNDFSEYLADLSFWEIAARDPKGNYAPAYGVDRLFVDWSTRRTKVIPRSTLNISLSSEFDRLLQRTPMELLP